MEINYDFNDFMDGRSSNPHCSAASKPCNGATCDEEYHTEECQITEHRQPCFECRQLYFEAWVGGSFSAIVESLNGVLADLKEIKEREC